MNKSSTVFVGMDVHKESIEIAIADEGEVRRYGQVGGDAASVDRVVRKLRSAHRDLVFVYEAGPCGFWLQRRLAAQRLACMVVSPSLTPRRPGERLKTDRRDAVKLARLARPGELTAILTCPMNVMRRCEIGCAHARTRWPCNARRGSDAPSSCPKPSRAQSPKPSFRLPSGGASVPNALDQPSAPPRPPRARTP